MNILWREWTTGDLTARDELQLELKSDVSILSPTQNTVFKQEFYLFLPSSLLINKETYTKEQFYQDETNLIRYKTPTFTFQELIHSKKSPIHQILHHYTMPDLYKTNPHLILDEIRLFGNIFRSTLRNSVHNLCVEMEDHSPNTKQLIHQLNLLHGEIKEAQEMYWELKKNISGLKADEELIKNLKYVDEFLAYTIQDYVSILLKTMRDLGYSELKTVDEQFTDLILQQKKHIEDIAPHVKEEVLLHHQSHLNKFVLESLMLKTNRIAILERQSHVVGGVAAAIAMTLYMSLFAWKSTDFVINSTPFILLAIILYVLKDRVKEGIKSLYHAQAFKWFPDFRTEIIDFDNHVIGQLSESFSYVARKDIPKAYLQIREKEWKDEIEEIDQQETIIRYKREVVIFPKAHIDKTRRSELNTFFRLNLVHLLQKASDPLQLHLDLNPSTLEIQSKLLPKIYYIYVILHQYYEGSEKDRAAEVRKFRIAVNKKGIKRVEG